MFTLKRHSKSGHCTHRYRTQIIRLLVLRLKYPTRAIKLRQINVFQLSNVRVCRYLQGNWREIWLISREMRKTCVERRAGGDRTHCLHPTAARAKQSQTSNLQAPRSICLKLFNSTFNCIKEFNDQVIQIFKKTHSLSRPGKIIIYDSPFNTQARCINIYNSYFFHTKY